MKVDLGPVVRDVRQKIKDSTFQTKKQIVPIKHKNLLSIISSVYSKSYELMKSQEIFKNFIFPLFETMLIIYGSMETE